METFSFFWLRFRRAYDSTYDSDFLFQLGHEPSYDFAYDSNSNSVASENQHLLVTWYKNYINIAILFFTFLSTSNCSISASAFHEVGWLCKCWVALSFG